MVAFALAALIAPAVATSSATAAEPVRHGLKGDYYLSSGPGLGDFVEYRSTQVDPNLDFDSLEGTLVDATSRSDEASVRWTGQLLPTFSEEYTFHAVGDNGFRVWVNGRLVVDHWVDDWSNPQTSAAIHLTAGKPVDFKVEYFEDWGDSSLHVDWSSPSTPLQPIPATAFLLPAGYVPPSQTTPQIADVTAALDALASEGKVSGSVERDLRALLAAAQKAGDYNTRIQRLQDAREWVDTAPASKLNADARTRLTAPLDALLTPRTPRQELSLQLANLTRSGDIASSASRDLLALATAGKLAELRDAIASASPSKVSQAAKDALLPPVDQQIAQGNPLNYTTAEAGNPIANGWYADPDIELYDGRYWVFPTTSRGYDQQTFMDAFSSTDLVHWTKHPKVLDIANVSWAKRALWAPAPVRRNGKYYLYFSANDIQDDSQLGGVGVAVADRPEGPYKDAIGKPLIGAYHNGAQPIDQDVFIDDDGQAYMYYGGHSHANVVKLNADMTSLGTFDDGTTFKEITPENYVEGSFMFKRSGIYYMMWSEGGWTGPDYSVSYAMSNSPTGPFKKVAKVLQQDPAVARGSGHNSVINVPGTDIWYIFYHRRPLSESDGNSRALSYDRMYFNSDGTIAPVKMLVKDNFADQNAVGWRTYGGPWSAAGSDYAPQTATATMALQDTDFGDFTYQADVKLTSANSAGGLVFRVADRSGGAEGFSGYYASLTSKGLTLSSWQNGQSKTIASAPMSVAVGESHRVRVQALGSSFKVFVDDMAKPALIAVDAAHTSGTNGLRASGAAGTDGPVARFDNVSIDHLYSPVQVKVGYLATRAGTTGSVPVTVTNTGNTTVTPTLSITVPDSWSVTPTAPAIPALAPGKSATVSVQVTIPAGAAPAIYALRATASWDGWRLPASGIVRVVGNVVDIEPGTMSETDALVVDNNSQLTEDDRGGLARYSDNDRSFTYRLPLPRGVTSGTVTIDMANEFLVEASRDGTTWTTVLKESNPITDRSNRAAHTLDLVQLRAQAGGQGDQLYLRFRDSFPEDGWGGWVADVRVDL